MVIVPKGEAPIQWHNAKHSMRDKGNCIWIKQVWRNGLKCDDTFPTRRVIIPYIHMEYHWTVSGSSIRCVPRFVRFVSEGRGKKLVVVNDYSTGWWVQNGAQSIQLCGHSLFHTLSKQYGVRQCWKEVGFDSISMWQGKDFKSLHTSHQSPSFHCRG